MVNHRASKEEIEALASDGWRFRKKSRKGILYVGARRGTNENSLGRYSDEYWAMIEDVVNGLKNKKRSAGVTQTQTESKEVTDPLILAWKELERI